jgi:sialic acid synthase SpsE
VAKTGNSLPFLGARQVYVVAEAEINHNGDVDLALRMVETAKEIGADCIKFQYIIADEIATRDSEYYALFKQAELGGAAFGRIFGHARDLGIDYFITVPSIGTIEPVLALKPPMLKVGSTNLTNLPLLRALADTGLPVVLSTGLGTLGEIETALEALRAEPSRVALLHCTVQYPAGPESANLRAIRTMQAAFPGYVVGYSDHTEGEVTAVAAVAVGARVLEKHFTLDRSLPGPDHGFSTDPEQFRRYVGAVRAAESALGDGRKAPVAVERPLLRSGRRYIVAARDIPAGSRISDGDLSLRRIRADVEGIAPDMLESLVGMRAPKAYRAGDAICWADFKA